MSLIGKSPAFREAIRLIEKMAGCDAPVLIEGETGTGKELAARALHYQGKRRNKPFIPFNCGAVPDALFENELFGHTKGAFTDAKQDQAGLVAMADSGTLFLDEMEALSPKGQVALLRFMQDQQYRPLGGGHELNANVRIITASNADLTRLVESGEFRQDLFFRLKILHLELPPLRERQGDAQLLAEHFVRIHSEQSGRPVKTFHLDTLTWFESYSWPGNIRELENLVYREFLLSEGPEIHINPEVQHQTERRKLSDRRRFLRNGHDFNQAKAKIIEEFEKRFLMTMLAEAHGNISLAAKLACKDRSALGKLIKKHRIDKNQYY
jgi:two-component system response regulator GlrR